MPRVTFMMRELVGLALLWSATLTLMPQPTGVVPASLNLRRHGMSRAKSSQNATPLKTPAVAVDVVRVVGRGAGLDRARARPTRRRRSGRRADAPLELEVERLVDVLALRIEGVEVVASAALRGGAARVDRERLAGDRVVERVRRVVGAATSSG